MEEIAAALDSWVVALTLAVAMLIAWTVGIWLGNRLLHRGSAKPSKFDDASMALLGLLLVFTFGMSISKHERRLALIADSNAIDDLYT